MSIAGDKMIIVGGLDPVARIISNDVIIVDLRKTITSIHCRNIPSRTSKDQR